MAQLTYVTLAPDGDVVSDHRSFDAAVRDAQAISGPMVLAEKVDERAQNPGRGRDEFEGATATAKSSYDRCGVKKVTRKRVERMSLEEAHARVSPIFQRMRWTQSILEPTGRMVKGESKYGKLRPEKRKVGERTAHGTEVVAYQTPDGLAGSMLTQNFKMDKREWGQEPTTVKGLSLLPHHLLRVLGRSPAFAEYRDLIRSVDYPSKWSLCDGSSSGCREVCLVYSGKNWVVEKNSKIKLAKTLALLKEPVAFLRLLWENCKKVEFSSLEKARFIRMNVLQDIPWERICPWLFDDVGVQFYDYTKVPGRKERRNYDLTFSFSGKNEANAKRELKRGRRLAVVFVGMRRTGTKKWIATGSVAKAPLPPDFWGRPVIDGDRYDMRAVDPPCVIVGLRYKTAYGAEIPIGDPSFSFVTPAYIVEGKSQLARPNPRARGGLSYAQQSMEYLVMSPSPRTGGFQYDPVVGPDEAGELDMLDEMVEFGDVDVSLAGELGF